MPVGPPQFQSSDATQAPAALRRGFGKDGDKVVILLAGGAKKRQDIDITNAKERWQDYKQRKKSEK